MLEHDTFCRGVQVRANADGEVQVSILTENGELYRTQIPYPMAREFALRLEEEADMAQHFENA
jgi:hypothetical protein